MTDHRPLQPAERALLDAFLAVDFDGVEALRAQVLGTTATPGCACGCGSVDLLPDPSAPRSTATSPVPVEGAVRDEADEEVGGLLLFLDDGRLASLEVYSYVDPLPLPPAERVRWTTRPEPAPKQQSRRRRT